MCKNYKSEGKESVKMCNFTPNLMNVRIIRIWREVGKPLRKQLTCLFSVRN